MYISIEKNQYSQKVFVFTFKNFKFLTNFTCSYIMQNMQKNVANDL